MISLKILKRKENQQQFQKKIIFNKFKKLNKLELKEFLMKEFLKAFKFQLRTKKFVKNKEMKYHKAAQ